MNHKRKKPKGSSCCMCNPHKHSEFKGSFNHQTAQERVAIVSEKEQMEDLYHGRSEDGAGN